MQWSKPSNADTRDDLSLLDLTASRYLDNKRWVRPSLSHPPESRRLFVAGSVCWIISGLDLRKPLHADGVNLRDPVLERGALDLILDLAIPQGAFEGDKLPLLESFGEVRKVPPGKDAMPFGAGFVVASVVLPAFLGCDVEDDVLAVVLSGFGFRVLSELSAPGYVPPSGPYRHRFPGTRNGRTHHVRTPAPGNP
jgi:hypothetical protein